MTPETPCTAFEGERRIAAGALAQVALKVKKVIDRGERAPVLIFNDLTSEQIELDLRGTGQDVLKRLAATAAAPAPATAVHPASAAPRGPGRPKLGVTAREVTLLPRQWDWLNRQPGGASVALRKLVEEARRQNVGKDHARGSQEAAYRFMSAMGGNLPGFEEAARALFANDAERCRQHITAWPADIREHTEKLVTAAFAAARA
jgi:hypothetical protein